MNGEFKPKTGQDVEMKTVPAGQITFAEFIAKAREMGVKDDTRVLVWSNDDANWGSCLPDLEYCCESESITLSPREGTGATLSVQIP